MKAKEWPSCGSTGCRRNLHGGEGFHVQAGSASARGPRERQLALRLPNEQHVRDGKVLRMGERQERAGGAELGEPLCRAAMKRELRRTMAADDLDTGPEDPA